MVNLKQVIDKLHSIIEFYDNDPEITEELSQCIDALVNISTQVRDYGVVLKQYGIELNGISYERRRGGGFSKVFRKKGR